MKISVIVPVYNAENTLINCLGNLLNQTFADMEMILVDDASTDGTPQILQDAKNQFPEKVRVFCQKKNHGPGAARNVGLEVATGDYVGFVDADDVVDVTMYEKLYNAAMSIGTSVEVVDATADVSDTSVSGVGADIVDCAFFRESQNKALLHFDKCFCGILDNVKKSGLIASGGFTVTKLFRRSLIEDINLRFRPEYGLEDMDFLIRAIAEAHTTAATEEVLYIYKDSNASLSKEMDFGKYYQNHIGALTGIYEHMHDLPDYADLQAACEYDMIALYSNILTLGYRLRNDIPRDILTELLDGAKSIRTACITIPISENPYCGNLSSDSRTAIDLADRSVDELLLYGESGI